MATNNIAQDSAEIIRGAILADKPADINTWPDKSLLESVWRLFPAAKTTKLDVIDASKIRSQFSSISKHGRIPTNTAASTQLPDIMIELASKLALTYENVHRGQSQASQTTTRMFENSYRVIASFVNARSWREIILYRSATEAINSVMYSLMTEFRDGDNLVTTFMEHNSNYVPWYALTHEILPRFGIRVECRIARFDRESGELDLDHMASLVDNRTKIICCTGASNFVGTKPPLDKIREMAENSGYQQPNGIRRSYLLIDGAQLVPNAYIDVVETDIDYLAWSFHKILAPIGVGALYAREEILKTMKPFQYGGDMIAEGQVTPEHVGYNVLPWRFAAGTPNIVGTIIAAEALRFLVNIVLGVVPRYFNGGPPLTELDRAQVKRAMMLVQEYERKMSTFLLEKLAQIKGLTVYGPRKAERRTAVVAFNISKMDPFSVATCLDKLGIESRAGCHCATLAHHFYHLNPPASCRISPYIYNTMQEMEFIHAALKRIAQHQVTC